MSDTKEETVKVYEAVIGNKIFISQNNSTAALPSRSFRCFTTQNKLKYFPFCDDFGPMNMGSVIRFIELLDAEIAAHPSHTIVYTVESGRRALSNAVFLLGAYMVLKLDMSATEVSRDFSWLDESMVESFRDATYSAVDFELTLLDCWRGLEKGKSMGWVQLPGKDPKQWGKINVDEYEHYDNPDQGDLHEVVPGKFVAVRGPKDLGGKTYFDDKRGYRHFSPSHYIPILADHGVTAVIRLNEASSYDARGFTSHGIIHHHLEFPDCTSPTPSVVERFFRVVDACGPGGALAVHCKAGLGRTGTLIALYLMRTHAFTAREAIGWLRIMRPGSVIGDQQHYLSEVERTVRDMLHSAAAAAAAAAPAASAGTAAPKRAAAASAAAVTPVVAPVRRAAAPASCAAALAAQVAHGMERRGAVRGRAGGAESTALPAIGGR